MNPVGRARTRNIMPTVRLAPASPPGLSFYALCIGGHRTGGKPLRGMAPRKRAFVVARAGDTRNSAKPEAFLLTMIDRDLEARGGAHHYSRWPEPWRPEDDWGPISAAVIFFIILCALIVYGSGVYL
jgi:hypothetical protein